MPKATFYVAGSGPFPIDMLRYDECRASGSYAQSLINLDTTDMRARQSRRVVKLYSDKSLPTIARWESFGWRVLSHEGTLFPRELGAEELALAIDEFLQGGR